MPRKVAKKRTQKKWKMTYPHFRLGWESPDPESFESWMAIVVNPKFELKLMWI
jgi:hypothetical protein